VSPVLFDIHQSRRNNSSFNKFGRLRRLCRDSPPAVTYLLIIMHQQQEQHDVVGSNNSKNTNVDACDEATKRRSMKQTRRAASELESFFHNDGDGENNHQQLRYFPKGCQKMLHSLPGNDQCIDCSNPNPGWASLSYGVLLCVQCSGKHRSYGVRTSTVRSVQMDTWSHWQILAMLEGGNQQLKDFFRRHQMDTPGTDAHQKRYHTNAGRFYRTHLRKHATEVAASGPYLGREVSRRRKRTKQQQHQSKQKQHQSQQGQTPPLETTTIMKVKTTTEKINHNSRSSTDAPSNTTSKTNTSRTKTQKCSTKPSIHRSSSSRKRISQQLNENCTKTGRRTATNSRVLVGCSS